MRVATLLIWSSVVSASATDLAAQSKPVRIEASRAGQSVRVELPPDVDGPVKLSTTVTKRDGTKIELPAVVVTPPQPPLSRIVEGPVLPPDCGGGKVTIEVNDVDTGELHDKAGAPIGF